MDWIIEHGDELLAIAGAVVIIASGIANFTETKEDDKWAALLKKLVNYLALNFSKRAGK